MSEQEKKAYRAAIRVEWKKIVRRGRFTSYEYKLIEQWFNDGVETAVIIQAIKASVERAKIRSLPVFSIGFVIPDIERIKRDRARMHVGSQKSDDNGWRERAAEALDEIAETSNPELGAMIRELKSELPELPRAEVERRYREIASR